MNIMNEKYYKMIEEAKVELKADMVRYGERLQEFPGSYTIIHNLYLASEGWNLLEHIPKDFNWEKISDASELAFVASNDRVVHLAYDSYDDAWAEAEYQI